MGTPQREEIWAKYLRSDSVSAQVNAGFDPPVRALGVLSHSCQEPLAFIFRSLTVVSLHPKTQCNGYKSHANTAHREPWYLPLPLKLADTVSKILSRNWYEPISPLRACGIASFVYAQNTDSGRSLLETEEVEKHVSL
jgi:hypothetical protein